jgi:hypothetical protein
MTLKHPAFSLGITSLKYEKGEAIETPPLREF